jgi:long-chain acyl-CoA synthetase
MDPWAIGATALIYAGQPGRAVWPRLAAAHGATIFAAVPGVFRQMLGAPALGPGFAGLRHALSAGESLPAPVREAFGDATGKPIYQALGMSELSTYVSASPSRPAPTGRTGYPQPGRRVAILPDEGADPLPRGAVGLLAVSRRDPGLMLGYWNRPDETAATIDAEGWLHTGDMARMDERGFFYIVDRKKDMILVSGFNVYPNEVEDVLAGMPGVLEVAVVGAPDEHSGEVVKAVIVRKDPDLTAEDVKAYAREYLTGYKRPHIVEFRTELPKSNVGKILRRELR